MNVTLFLEIKEEYTEHLIDTLTPFIYEGLNSIYQEAVKSADDANSKDKTLLIFQKFLLAVNGWNQIRIEKETTRIKQLSNTADYLDDLVRAVMKTNIILLTYSNTISNMIGQTFYNTINTATFIHRCYTECAKDAHNNPYLFYHDITPMDLKRNQIIIQQNIRNGVIRAIRKMLPISMILKEYLVNSINIIQEPPKIELVGTPKIEQIIPPVGPGLTGLLSPSRKQLEEKPKSEKNPKIDPKIEREVMNIIKTEDLKTDKEKLRAIMNIDKIITNIENSGPGLVSPRMNEMIDMPVEPAPNISEQKIFNRSSQDPKKSVSPTVISNNPVVLLKSSRANELSERVDPNKIELIEEYGQFGGKKRKQH